MRGLHELFDLPSVTPHITQVERYGGTDPSCQQLYESLVPAGFEPESPFGPQIASLFAYLHYHHAVCYQCLRQLMWEVFELAISEGVIVNVLRRV